MKTSLSDPRKHIAEFIIIFKSAGLAPFSANKKEQIFLIIFQIIHFLLIIYIFICVVFILKAFEEGSNLSSLVSILIFVASSIVHFIFNLESMFIRSKQRKVFDIFSKIDNAFSAKLGVRVDNAKMNRKYTIWFAMGTVMVLFSDGVLCLAKYLNGYNNGFWFTVFSRLILKLRMFQCLLYVQIASERLTLVNTKLNEINALGQNFSNFTIFEADGIRRSDMEEAHCLYSINQILALKDIFGRVWEVVNVINDCFGWSLLAIISYCFLDFTSNGYWLFLAMEDIVPDFVVLECLCRMIQLGLMLSVLSWICDMCKRESEETGRVVRKFRKSTNNEQYNSLISEFSLQIMHESIRVSASGFFTIDFELLGSMAATTVTYLVILIQFLLNENDH